MKKIALLLPFLLFALSGAMAQSPQPDDILGVWLNEDKDAHIYIHKANGKYHGKIIWLREPIDPETGQPKLDKENPDREKQKQPVIGSLILRDFVFDDGTWDDGSIYDPKNGKTYDCYMELTPEGNLKIRGYVGISLIGRTTYWTPVEEE